MKRTVVACVVAAGCGSVASPKADSKLADTPGGGSDSGGGIDAPAARCDPSKPFGTPALLANVNSTSDDFTPFVTPNELELWFASNRPGSQAYDIWMATRASKTADFGQPALVAGVNTAGNDTRPELTADGLSLYIQYQASSTSLYHIARATRTSTTAAFGAPSNVAELTSSANDDAQFVMPDHSAIYFMSNRGSGYMIYHAVRGTDGTFGSPAPVAAIDINNGTGVDYPTVVADDLTFYFLSNRSGGAGGNDNWKATRTSAVQAFGAATNVTELNAPDGYVIMSVTADNCIAYLQGPGTGGNDLYVAKKPL